MFPTWTWSVSTSLEGDGPHPMCECHVSVVPWDPACLYPQREASGFPQRQCGGICDESSDRRSPGLRCATRGGFPLPGTRLRCRSPSGPGTGSVVPTSGRSRGPCGARRFRWPYPAAVQSCGSGVSCEPEVAVPWLAVARELWIAPSRRLCPGGQGSRADYAFGSGGRSVCPDLYRGWWSKVACRFSDASRLGADRCSTTNSYMQRELFRAEKSALTTYHFVRWDGK